MDRLRLNDEPLDFTLEEADTMETIVAQIAKWRKEFNEYPVRLLVDGTEHSFAHNAWHTIPLAGIGTVDVYTFCPTMLRDYLPKLDSVSQLLQSGGQAEAMKLIFKVSTLISYLITIIPSLGAVNGSEVQSLIQTLTVNLHDLQRSIQNEDAVLTGDLLEYEIRGKVEQLLTAINM